MQVSTLSAQQGGDYHKTEEEANRMITKGITFFMRSIIHTLKVTQKERVMLALVLVDRLDYCQKSESGN